MQILWNRVPTKKIRPARGIRQGCPLSPYLFVLCMEWLGHSFQIVVNTEEWSPIRLSRSIPALSHLFFADNLVIFAKADKKHSMLLKDILERFWTYSGHRINVRKTNIFFSIGVDEIMSNQISRFMGFQKFQNLGIYLGIPLLHSRITKGTLEFVVEKVRAKLQSWDVKQLSIAGRLTLAKSILLTIPNYFMQSIQIPKGVSEEIE
ncbi:hypothetical protein PVK06_047065 [Gossypium arboreum]|uniref:Reverse transcriptase domain-containing protein n=1 Tax=Gossypium arboreum TaxID=29729 RepID=A0ABR0MCG2_GOSAR|nr:hypothetical protein PVK06_047065 [Gossypium arboreum]